METVAYGLMATPTMAAEIAQCSVGTNVDEESDALGRLGQCYAMRLAQLMMDGHLLALFGQSYYEDRRHFYAAIVAIVTQQSTFKREMQQLSLIKSQF